MAQRVWDRFLTERDKARSSLAQRQRIGFGVKPALLLVDVYRGVFGDEPESLLESMKTWPYSCGLEGWAALPHFQALLADARNAGIPVVYVKGISDAAEVANWRQLYGNERQQTTPAEADRLGRMYDIMPEVAPIVGEAVFPKAAPSAFFGTPLASHLVRNGVDTLIVTGETTSGCVRASVVDAFSYRYRVIVAEECSFDRDEATHALNLYDMNEKYCDVLPVAEVRAWLNGYSELRNRVRGVAAG